MSSTQSGIQPTGVQDPNAKTVTWKLVLTRTYELYAAKFWTYFRIAVIPAVLAYAFSYLARMGTLRLLRGGILPFLSGKWIALSVLLSWATSVVYWAISAFFFAAIAANFATEDGSSLPAVADAYTLPRKRIGSIAMVAFTTCTLFLVGRVVAGLAIWQLLKIFRVGVQDFWTLTIALGVMFLMLATLICKFGLAIPELMHNGQSSVGSAMKRSLKETQGWEVFFMMFLAKSAAIGYGIYWIAGLGLDWLWQHWTLNLNSFSWVQWSVYIFIAAIVETPLFIAFSVLYEKLHEKAEAHVASATD